MFEKNQGVKTLGQPTPGFYYLGNKISTKLANPDDLAHFLNFWSNTITGLLFGGQANLAMNLNIQIDTHPKQLLYRLGLANPCEIFFRD